MGETEQFLGNGKISKLLISFSIPCVISFIVTALYNIVDQIFIGRGVNYLANGATNVVFPLVMVCGGFAFLFGDGAASYLSLKLGAGKKDDAAKGVATGILMTFTLGLIFCILANLFLPDLLKIFGCTEALKEYAMTYGSIIVMGVPFFMTGIALNAIIRADGNPKFSMFSMLTGAIINTILDPIFIFGLHLGIAGAAYATIISQTITFCLNARYLTKLNTITLNKKLFSYDFSYIKRVSSLGISSFINHISIVAVMAVSNNLMVKYGSQSKFGSEIPITVLGIVMKICMILNSVIIGISVGSQPIIGYNYGAKLYGRVKKTLQLVLTTSSVISVIAFIFFQTIPETLIGIFGAGDSLYTEFATLAFRIYLFFCFCYGIQIPAGIFFQSIGKSKISATLSLSRQVLILIPAFVIFGSMFGIMGLLYAGAVADFLAFLLACFFLIREMKILGKRQEELATKKNPLDSIEAFSGELFEVVKNEGLISIN